MKDPNYHQMPHPYPVGDPKQQVRSARTTLAMLAVLIVVAIILVILIGLLR